MEKPSPPARSRQPSLLLYAIAALLIVESAPAQLEALKELNAERSQQAEQSATLPMANTARPVDTWSHDFWRTPLAPAELESTPGRSADWLTDESGAAYAFEPAISAPDIDFSYTREMDDIGLITTALSGAAVVGLLGWADDATIEDVGDISQILLPVTAGAATLTEDTWEGAGQFGMHAGAAIATMGVGKLVFARWRPTGSNTHSFPSGHTTGAFLGASFIGSRYGPRYGVAAYTWATYTAISRVIADAHFLDDTIAGASISQFYAWALVTPYEPGKTNDGPTVQATPLAGGGSLSLGMAIRPRRAAKLEYVMSEDPKPKRWRYELEVGSAATQQNKVTSPNPGGTPLDYAEFDSRSNPDIFAMGSLEFFLSDRSEVMFRIMPNEQRDETTFTSPVQFAGQTFAPGQLTNTQYISDDYRLRWRYDFDVPGPWILKAGASLSYLYTEAALGTSSGQYARTTQWAFMPLAHGHAGIRFLDDFRAIAEIDGGGVSGASYIDTTAKVIWDFSHHWDVGLGYRFVNRFLDDPDLLNSLWQHRFTLSVAHSW